MTRSLNLLVIEDTPSDFLLIERRLSQDGLNVRCLNVDTRDELAAALETGGWDVVLSDYNMPELDFNETLAQIRKHDPDLPLILVSGTVGEEVAVDLLRQGVRDFVLKDRLARLATAIKRAIADAQARRDQRATEQACANEAERRRQLFEQSREGIIVHDLEGRVVEANPSFAALIGRPLEEVSQLHIWDWDADFNRKAVLETIPKTAPTGMQFETRHRRPDGSLIDVEVSVTNLDLDGEQLFLAQHRDITERKAAETLITRDREQQAMLRDLLESTLLLDTLENTLAQCLKKLLDVSWLSLLPKGGVFLLDTDGQHLRLAVAHNLDRDVQEQCARVPLGHCHCGRAAATRQVQHTAQVDAQHTTRFPCMADHGHYNLPLLSNEKTLGVLALFLSPGFQDDPIKEQFLASVGNILAGYISRKQYEERLRLSAAVLESTHEGVLVTDLDGHIQAVNPAFTRITGYSEAEALGKTPVLLRSHHHDASFYQQLWESIKQTGVWQGEIRNRRKSGDVYPEWLTISAVHDERGVVSNYVGVFSDISQIKNAEERLSHIAHYDLLTDLPNRLLLQTLLKHALDRAQRARHGLAVLFIDLDRFKNVNDSLGHTAGDELLCIVAERLKQRARDSDTLARLGGDEFVMLLEKIDNPNDAALVAEDLIELLKHQIQLTDGHEVYVGASIGISVFPNDGATAEKMIRNSDAAMYQAKEGGRNTYRFYTEDLTLYAQQRLRMEGRLRHALSHDEFLLHYQPLVGNGCCKGVEALVRWQDPDDGLVSPMEFIPLAEETHLIIPLGEWVLRTACAQMKAWLDAGLPLDTLAVNLSPVQLQQPDIAQRVARILDETGLPVACLELEITESAIMEQGTEAEATLASLHELGIRLAIDDFGTGYSSLAYLKRFPIHKLKIDQSFVKDIPESSAAMEIAATIIAMAKNLHLEVLAEGVETSAQFEFLKERGCDTFQGYLFSKPLPAESIPALWPGWKTEALSLVEKSRA